MTTDDTTDAREGEQMAIIQDTSRIHSDIITTDPITHPNAQVQAVLELIREQRAQGYNAVSLDRITRAIEEATP